MELAARDNPTKRTLRPRRWLLSSLALALALLGYGLFERYRLLDAAAQQTRYVADHTASQVEGALFSIRQVLQSMAVLQQSGQHDRLKERIGHWKTKERHLMDLLILDAHGNIQTWTGTGPAPSVKDRSYFTAHLHSKDSKIHVGPPLLSKVHTGQWFFAMSEALRNDQGQLKAVMVAIVDIALLRDQLRVATPTEGGSHALLTMDGIVYIRNPGLEQYIGQQLELPSSLKTLMRDGKDGFILHSNLDGQDRFVAITSLRHYPLVATGSLRIADILAPWYILLAQLGGIWLLSNLILGIAYIVVTRRHRNSV